MDNTERLEMIARLKGEAETMRRDIARRQDEERNRVVRTDYAAARSGSPATHQKPSMGVIYRDFDPGALPDLPAAASAPVNGGDEPPPPHWMEHDEVFLDAMSRVVADLRQEARKETRAQFLRLEARLNRLERDIFKQSGMLDGALKALAYHSRALKRGGQR